MRSYTTTLLFEDALDLVPSGQILNSVDNIFSPNIPVMEDDCGTLLGEKKPISLDILGLMEVGTLAGITRNRINQATSLGYTHLYVRGLNTCITRGGICRTCYQASKSRGSAPAIGGFAKIPPEFIIQTETITPVVGTSSITLAYDVSTYDRAYVFVNSVQIQPSGYTITGMTLALTTPVAQEAFGLSGVGTITIQYAVITKSPYVYWLAGTYAGSLLGMSPVPSRRLAIKSSLHSSNLPTGDVEYLTQNLLESSLTTPAIAEYLQVVVDPLEKAVLVSLLNAIYVA